MRIVRFKLPKTLHSGDVFEKELRLKKSESWYGFNKKIYTSSNKEDSKIAKNTVFCFLVGEYQSLLTVGLDYLPNKKKCNKFTSNRQPYYDISNIGRMPLKMNKINRIILTLRIAFKNKQYIKFKKEPIIFINIFSSED